MWGPDSITWRVHADPLTGIAVLRGMALRALDPHAVDPVASGGPDLWHRVDDGRRYLGVITFGSAVDALMAAARLRAAYLRHDVANGSAAGHDDLVLWGHCCHVASLLDVALRGGLVLTPQEQERYLKEQVKAAVMLGLEPHAVPAGRAAYTRFFRERRGDLTETAQSRALAAEVLAPVLPAAMLSLGRSRPAWAPAAGLALSSLPGWARRCYGLPRLTGPGALGPAATTVALHSLKDSLITA